MRLSELLKNGDFYGNFDPETEITGVCSRLDRCEKGSLFIAVSGSRFDGAAHLEEAFARGAGAVVTEKEIHGKNIVKCKNVLSAFSGICAAENGDPQKKLTLIGLTGTNGKTTTSYICSRILNSAGIKTEIVGSVNFENTTPEPPVFFSALGDIAERGPKAVVCEVSSQGLDQHRVDPCRFRVGAFLNFGTDHLDYHGTPASYFECKKKLKTLSDIFAVNGDDRHTASLISDGVKSFSLFSGGDYVAANVSETEDGSRFSLLHNGTETPVSIGLVGIYNVYNALAALTVSCELGVPETVAAKALEKPLRIPGRMEKIGTNAPFSVYVDYAHTPQALATALRTLRARTKGRLIAVFGCGGDRDREKRPEMGKQAALFADEIIVTSDNPRTEDPDEIIKDILSGADKRRFTVVPDRRSAIGVALDAAREGDCVIIAGKGHEKYQIVGKKKLPFDDAETVAEMLRRYE